MQRYDIKKGHFKNIEAGKLKELMMTKKVKEGKSRS